MFKYKIYIFINQRYKVYIKDIMKEIIFDSTLRKNTSDSHHFTIPKTTMEKNKSVLKQNKSYTVKIIIEEEK